jgi:spore coat protein H
MIIVWLLCLRVLITPSVTLLPEGISDVQSCTNQLDDDGDFLADCEEQSCWAHPHCQPSTCEDTTQCQRSECASAPPCFEANCFDQRDNDQDSLTDCFDPDCDTYIGCMIEQCSDNEDNDLNGATDCFDPQCKDRDGCLFSPCTGRCLGLERCDDFKDNDQDNLFDCRDPDCFATEACGGRRDNGAGCSVGEQCASGMCLSELSSGYPDGLCSQACSETTTCAEGFICAGSVCLQSCKKSDDCRDGYSCFTTEEGNACLPDCGSPWDCPDSGMCNVYSGYCTAELGRKRDLARCTQGEECESGHCIDGFCTSLCASSVGCPEQFTCRVELGGPSDAGICVPDSFGVDFVAPWDQPPLLAGLYQEQRLSSSVLTPLDPSDEASALFSLERVHTIHLSIKQAEREKLSLTKREWVRASFSFDGEALEEIGLRLKGGDGSGEELPQKAAFSLKFDAFTRDLSFYGVKKLLLNNAMQDPSYISEPLTYWLYERYGVPAPRTAFAEVYVDGELYGLYVIVEAKDKRFLQSRLGHSAPLYEGSYGADFDKTETLEEHIEGGRPTLEVMQNFLLQTSPQQLLPGLSLFLDLDQFFLVWALESFFDHWDGYLFQVNNFYLYQDKDERFRFLPHGADQLFGTRDTRIDATPSGAIAKQLALSTTAKGRFMQEIERLMVDPSLEDDFRTKVDSLLQLIHEAAARDPKRKSNEAERELFSLWMREYIRARRGFIESTGAYIAR